MLMMGSLSLNEIAVVLFFILGVVILVVAFLGYCVTLLTGRSPKIGFYTKGSYQDIDVEAGVKIQDDEKTIKK